MPPPYGSVGSGAASGSYGGDAPIGGLADLDYRAHFCVSSHMDDAEFLDMILRNPVNAALLRLLPKLGLRDCYLTAGCLFQTVWNVQSRRSPTSGIKDYDIFYFDDDLSWEAENAEIQRLEEAAQSIECRLELRNQARVHLWFTQRFGGDYPQLASTREGIDRYLIASTCVGVEVQRQEVYAPDGFIDLVDGRLRCNPNNPTPSLFLPKAIDYQMRWPWLSIVEESLNLPLDLKNRGD